MNLTIMELTARQLLGKRRTILLLFFALLPSLIAVAYRLGGNGDRLVVDSGTFIDQQAVWTAGPLMSRLVVSLLLPLCALVFGTAALGSEIEDGTAVYLLSKPIARWRVIVSKLVVAWAATVLLVLPAAAIAGFITLAGSGGHFTAAAGATIPIAGKGHFVTANAISVTVQSGFGVLPGFLVAIAAGAFLYTALFVALSIFTSRALIAGLLYVFFWEALLTNLFPGLRIVSVRQYTLGIAHSLANVNERIFTARLSGPEAVILLAAASAVAIFLGVRRLERWEVGESS
jgi:ABC-2 type transport system permease protein